MREDDPMFYKVRMQKLINQARKNGLKVDASIYDGPGKRSVKVLFKDPVQGDCAGVEISRRER